MIRVLLCLFWLGAPAAADRLDLLSDTRWSVFNRQFGGLSGLHISPDGTTVLAITDRGLFVRAALKRKDGQITAIMGTTLTPIKQINGAPVAGRNSDAEGLAIGPKGLIYVSFEGFHRIRTYQSPDSKAGNIRGPSGFRFLQKNSGLEALAMAADNVLYAIPERSGKLERPFPVFRLKSGRWDKDLSIPRSKEYLPTDAAFGPDGKFYLLERDLAGVFGFRTRIRQFSLGPNGFTDENILLESRAGTYDNLEGISLWRDPGGGIRIALVSDNNFFPFQKTQIVEFLLVDD